MGDRDELPLDSDSDSESDSDGAPGAEGRPIHLRLRSVGLVVLGGALGTAAREGAALAIPRIGGLPVATFAVNVLGAFLLGVLLEGLARRGADEGRRRSLRLLLGTGFCGGFTTYSTLATDTVGLGATGGALGAAFLYGALTVLVGACATWLGIACGALGGRR